MNKIFTFFATVIIVTGFVLSSDVKAQPPEKLSYQAIIREDNDLAKNHVVTIRISILQNSETGTAVYSETHSVTTNKNGLVTLGIGSGTSATGNFSAIDWADGPYFIKSETTLEGETEAITGTSQLLSVPFALIAKSVKNESDPLFTVWDKSSGILISEEQVTDLKDYLTEETQNLSDVLILNNSAGSSRITNLAEPVNPKDAATKAYVDEIINTLSAKGVIVADIEDNIYSTVRIGSQIWMAENLKTTKFNDGTSIPLVIDDDAWSKLTTPGYSYFNNSKATYGDAYGALYNWYTVNTGKLCPSGWHVPSDEEWVKLMDYLGGESVAGGKLKETGNEHWIAGTAATNETGFTLRGGSCRFAFSTFGTLKDFAYIWSSTSFDETTARSVEVWYGNTLFVRPAYPKKDGFSARCLKD